jgi:hypothetical protein
MIEKMNLERTGDVPNNEEAETRDADASEADNSQYLELGRRPLMSPEEAAGWEGEFGKELGTLGPAARDELIRFLDTQFSEGVAPSRIQDLRRDGKPIELGGQLFFDKPSTRSEEVIEILKLVPTLGKRYVLSELKKSAAPPAEQDLD